MAIIATRKPEECHIGEVVSFWYDKQDGTKPTHRRGFIVQKDKTAIRIRVAYPLPLAEQTNKLFDFSTQVKSFSHAKIVTSPLLGYPVVHSEGYVQDERGVAIHPVDLVPQK